MKLISVLKTHRDIHMICLRIKSGINVYNLAIIFRKIAKKFNISKIIISGYITIANKLKFDGISLSSKSFHLLNKIRLDNLWSIISVHNEIEIKQAISYNSDAICYSSIFRNKIYNLPIGLDKFKKIQNKYKEIDIFALGGINNEEKVEILKKNNITNMASISYFTKR